MLKQFILVDIAVRARVIDEFDEGRAKGNGEWRFIDPDVTGSSKLIFGRFKSLVPSSSACELPQQTAPISF